MNQKITLQALGLDAAEIFQALLNRMLSFLLFFWRVVELWPKTIMEDFLN